MNLNKVFLIGRLTADPQLRSTATGQQVTNFSIATNRVWNDKNNQRQESTEFHNIVAWGRQAEVASQYLIKGSLVLVEGRLQTREWEGKDGQKRRTTEIVTERIQLGPKPAGGQQRENTPETPVASKNEIPTIDMTEQEGVGGEDLPF